jgi:adhesin transport system outer membrane protein
MKRKHWTLIVPGAVLLCATPALGVELRDAVQSALSTNPEIRQAVANRIATQEERVQATGL